MTGCKTFHFWLSALLLILLSSTGVSAQDQVFTRSDTLRGSITPERAWWDLSYYHLSISVNPSDSSFTGSNLIGYRVMEPGSVMQIDLQPPMKITKVSQNGSDLEYAKDGNAWFVKIKNKHEQGELGSLLVEFSESPK